MHSTAAIRENRSTHCDMSMIGSLAGGGGRPGTAGSTSSMVTSDISTNSRSSIFLTIFMDRAAAGLKGWVKGLGQQRQWRCLDAVALSLLGGRGGGEQIQPGAALTPRVEEREGTLRVDAVLPGGFVPCRGERKS